MMEQVFATADKLSEVIENMQKCLQCSICLHTISKPVKTRCGHRFCHECIQTVLQNKNALCPLCNTILLRRSISKDEHMELYIDRLEKLINAIQMDTGIDISLPASRPRSTRESCSSGTADCQKLDPEASIQPSCSIVSATAPRKQRRSSAGARTRGKQSKKTKTAKDSSRASDITKYLNKCPLSGVEPLLPDEPADYQEDNSLRVQNWLQTLPKPEVCDDPDRAAPGPPIDCCPNDTLTYSTSRNPKNDKAEKLDDAGASKLGQPTSDNDDIHHRDSLHSRAKDPWIRENKENETHGEGLRGNAKGVAARTGSVVVDDQKPSTSGFRRPKGEWKERSAQEGVQGHEKTGDVHRTSPCDMLPSMKENWSSVVRFGKEMRGRRKKLRSLDVSIESKGKPRSLDESVKEGAVGSRVVKGTSGENERDTPESVAVNRADERAFEEGLPNVEGARGGEQRLSEEASAGDKGDRSVSEGAQPAKGSSFITLDEGEQVHIKDLKSHQMNDIIGVAGSSADRLGSEIESVLGNRAPRGATTSLGKRGDLPEAQDRSKTPFPATPSKDTAGRSSARCNVAEEPNQGYTSPFLRNRNVCSPGEEIVDGINDSALKYQSPVTSPTTSRNRLSLKRRSTDPKSNEAQSEGSVSRLLAVKRDLSRQMDGDEGEMGDEAGDGGLTSKRGGKLEGNGGVEGRDVGDPSAGSGGASISNKALRRKEQTREQARHVVAFKKLGKVVKARKTPIKFLYLGTTRRTMLRSRDVSAISVVKPCNPVESSDLCVQMDPEKLSTTGDSFGNSRRITVNDTVATEQGDTQSNLLAAEKGTEAITREKLDAEKGQSASDQPGPSTNRASTTKRVDMYKETTPKDFTRVINSATSKSQDSADVLFVSLYDEQASAKRDCPINHHAADNAASKSAIRMLSPKKDSQLKFLSLDSPTTDGIEAARFAQQADAVKDASSKKSSFSDIRGAHSRALILRSQQASGGSTPDSSSALKRKRKRSSSPEKPGHGTKRKSTNEEGGPTKDDDSGSDCSHSSKTTLIGRDADENGDASRARQILLPGPSTRDVEVASLSSDTGEERSATQQRRAYRRIIRVASSDTDSPDVFCVDSDRNTPNDAAASGRVAASPTSKRKRAESLDSDDDEDVNVIVSSWYKSLNPSEIDAKKGKVEQARAPSALQKKREASLRIQRSCSSDSDRPANRMFSVHRRRVPELATNSEGSSYQGARRQVVAKGLFDDDSPDFGATIDKIREFEVAASVNDRDSGGRQRATRDASLMHDNFDEVIANMDTQALIGEFSGGKQAKRRSGKECLSKNEAGKVSEPVKPAVTRPRASNTDTSTSLQSDGSNKENKYQNAGMVRDVESDDEVSLTPEYANASNRSSRKSSDRLKPCEPTGRGGVSNGSLASKPVVESGKLIPREEGSKDETCYEYDSLMDVTQHDLLIKQFEEDLFGRPLGYNAPSEAEKHARKQRTPQKLKTKDAPLSDSKGKDAEHSGEEDDIVENTPDVKTRSIQTTGSTSKESSTWTPVSRNNGKQLARTPSSAAGRSSSSAATPLCRRNIHPLYQSTPKAQVVAKSNGGASTCTGGKKPNPVASKNEPFDERNNPVAGKGARSEGREQLCFVCSGLVASQIESVKRLAQTVNARCVTQFEQGVSHVIVRVNQDNGASKTLKYLQGIAHRKWIVGYQWVLDSLREKKLVDEERYEPVDCRTLEAGPRNSRLREKGLFEGFVFLCKGPYVDVSVEQYQELLRATGAIVVDSLEALTAEKRRLKIIVIQADVYNNEIIGWYKKARAVPIVHDWVVECISQYKLISVYPYLQELSRRDVLALGYPEFLVAEDPDEDSDSNGDLST